MSKIVNVLYVLAVFGVFAAAMLLTMHFSRVSATNNDNVTICHATGSQNNPYSKITVDDAVDGDGNSDHNRSGHQNGQDIIPPGYWDWSGRNWTTQGQAIYNNNCNVPQPSPSPSPSSSPQVSPSPTLPPVSPSPSPLVSPSPSPSSSPEVTPEPTPESTPQPSPTPQVSPTPTPTPCGDACKPKEPERSIPTATVCADGVPGGVGNIYVHVGVKNDGKLEVRWSNASPGEGATKAHIIYGRYGHGAEHALLNTDNDGVEEIGYLKNGQNYHFRVALVNGCAVGSWSSEYDPMP